ncbi:MAG: protein of unknown function DUF88 [Bacteroidetes bacterium]|nr:MAG: protein of unknown function DUF88 [Bacteroidota bacterium]
MLTYQINNNKKTEIEYLFVDGGYLDKVISEVGKNFWNSDSLPIDYQKLGFRFDKIFYYNCLPGRKNGENDTDYECRINLSVEFYEKLKMLDKFHVFEGVTFGRKNKIRQKTVDIMISVDMLRHSFRKNMDKAFLLTGDLDFKPLIEALILEGMYTTVIYSDTSFSKELLFVADSNQRITIKQIHDWLPDEIKPNYQLPELKQNYRIESPVILKQGEVKNKQITLLGRDENEFWLQINKSTFWKFHSEHKLIWFYEDMINEKIKWIK